MHTTCSGVGMTNAKKQVPITGNVPSVRPQQAEERILALEAALPKCFAKDVNQLIARSVSMNMHIATESVEGAIHASDVLLRAWKGLFRIKHIIKYSNCFPTLNDVITLSQDLRRRYVLIGKPEHRPPGCWSSHPASQLHHNAVINQNVAVEGMQITKYCLKNNNDGPNRARTSPPLARISQYNN